MLEAQIDRVKQIARPITEEARFALVTDLRATPSDIDGRRTAPWKRGNIYFHSLQDIQFASSRNLAWELSPKDSNKYRKGSQACFVKDLDYYFAGFPPDETEMRQLFQTVFDTGTSAYWHRDTALIDDLNKLYWEMDEEVIRPWAHLVP